MRLLAGFAASMIISAAAAAEPAVLDKPGEAEKAATISKLEAEIEEANNRKTKAAKEDNRDEVKRIFSDLKSLRLQLSKAKSKTPEEYAEEAAAAREQARMDADKKRQADETTAFWANPRGRAAVAAARLYRDLQTFRGKPDFAQFGLGRGGPYHLWLTAAEAVAAKDGKAGALKMMEKHNCSLDELAALGMEYARSGGKETAYTADVERRLGPAMQTIEKEAEERAREKRQRDAGQPAAAP
jgi:hypothetical protein